MCELYPSRFLLLPGWFPRTKFLFSHLKTCYWHFQFRISVEEDQQNQFWHMFQVLSPGPNETNKCSLHWQTINQFYGSMCARLELCANWSQIGHYRSSGRDQTTRRQHKLIYLMMKKKVLPLRVDPSADQLTDFRLRCDHGLRAWRHHADWRNDVTSGGAAGAGSVWWTRCHALLLGSQNPAWSLSGLLKVLSRIRMCVSRTISKQRGSQIQVQSGPIRK